jgi:large subunit ribosomal protein L10
MSRRVKELLTEELKSTYEQAEGGLLVDLTGLKANDTHALRGELQDKQVTLHMIRNRLARRAFAGHALEPLGSHLVGPCALVTGGSTIDLARLMQELAKKYPAIKLKSGLVEGDMEARPGEVIAKLKPLSELLGEIAGCLGSPGGRIAGCLQSPAGKIAGCVKAIIEKQEGAAA